MGGGKMKRILIFTVVFALLLSAPVLGATFVSLQGTENVDGSIGLYLENEKPFDIHPDYKEYDDSYLVFSYNGSNITIVDSPSTLSEGEKGLVVLDKAWPTSGYIKLNITYRDSGSVYEQDSLVVFSKKGLTKKSVSFGEGRKFYNETLKLTLTLKGSGDEDAKNIHYGFVSLSDYYNLQSHSIPGRVPMGEELEFKFTFKPAENLEDTVIYKTMYFPLKVTYTYYGFNTFEIFNESITVFNDEQVKGGDVPTIRIKIETPSEIIAGESALVKVYAYNNNTGGHTAEAINFTLSTGEGTISIPIHTILPGENLEPKADFLSEPSATFNISTSKNTPIGKVKLNLKVSYKDSILRFTDSKNIEKEITIVKEQEEEQEEEEVEEEEEPEEEETEVEEEETTEEEEEKEPKSAFNFYLILGIIAAVMIFIVVHILRVRSQYI